MMVMMNEDHRIYLVYWFRFQIIFSKWKVCICGIHHFCQNCDSLRRNAVCNTPAPAYPLTAIRQDKTLSAMVLLSYSCTLILQSNIKRANRRTGELNFILLHVLCYSNHAASLLPQLFCCSFLCVCFFSFLRIFYFFEVWYVNWVIYSQFISLWN